MNESNTVLAIVSKVVSDVLIAANTMRGTVIAAAALGGLCLLGYYIWQYYKSFDKELISKEHALAIFLIIFGFITLPVLGVIFAGIYEINNVMAAWQIGLTTPLIIKSAYISSAGQAQYGKYHKNFTPDETDA